MGEGHDHSHLSDTELWVRSLESLLVDNGIVDPEKDEPVLHHEWERRIFALTLASGAACPRNVRLNHIALRDAPTRMA
jgi:hypothetical protein